MPIIFQDEMRRRARRRWAAGAVIFVALVAMMMFFLARVVSRPVPGSPASLTQSSPQVTKSAERDYPEAITSKSIAENPAINSNGCSTVDGDTLNCSGTRVRLLGIDAPEMPGHCRIGRHCVSGDPFRAAEALKQAIEGHDIRIIVVGADRYGRSLANVYVNGKNIACQLIEQRMVEYVERWDNEGLVSQDCQNSGL